MGELSPLPERDGSSLLPQQHALSAAFRHLSTSLDPRDARDDDSDRRLPPSSSLTFRLIGGLDRANGGRSGGGERASPLENLYSSVAARGASPVDPAAGGTQHHQRQLQPPAAHDQVPVPADEPESPSSWQPEPQWGAEAEQWRHMTSLPVVSRYEKFTKSRSRSCSPIERNKRM